MVNAWKNLFQYKFNCIFIILYLALLAHGISITDTFKILDNDISIINNILITDFKYIPELFATSYFGDGQFYRPVTALSHMIEYRFFSLNAAYYHLNNILIHGIASVFVFLIITRLFGRQFFGLATGILFAIHPIHWEAVANIPGRSILLCTMFYLASFYGYIKFIDRHRSPLTYAFSILCFIAALLSKESAITLPLLLGVYVVMFAKREGEGKDLIKTTVPFWIMAIAIIVIRSVLGISKVQFTGGINETVFPFLTFLKSLLIHFQLMVLPMGFYYDRSYPIFRSIADPQLLATLCVWAGIIGLLIVKRKSINKNIQFLIIWFILSVALTSQFLFFVGASPGMIAASDHLMYLPGVSLCALMVYGGDKLVQWVNKRSPQRISIVRYQAIAVFVVFFAVTVLNDLGAREEIPMLRYSHLRNPENKRVHQSYAIALNRAGHHDLAEAEFKRLLEVDPGDVRAHIGIGRVYCDQKELRKCIAHFEQAAHFSGQEASIIEDLKRLYGYFIEENEAAALGGSKDPLLYFQLGIAYRSLGDEARSGQYFLKAQQLTESSNQAQ